MKNFGGWLIWGVGAFYSLLCVLLPEVRPYIPSGYFYTGEHKRWGLLGCIEFAMAVWLPGLFYAGIAVGLIAEQHIFGVYLLALLGVVVAIIGGWVEILS